MASPIALLMAGGVVSTFPQFEHAGWEDADVCSAYQDRLGPVVAQAVEPMLEAVGLGSTDTVLDVATGGGVVAAAAARRGASVIGVDFSEEQLGRARAAHPDIRFEVGEADALPFGPASFDVVVSSFGVPHFPDPEAFFRDSLRVLGPAGRFAFTVWATPERAKGFEIVFAAVKRHGTLQVGLPPAPDFFLYADPETSRASLTAAGFDAVTTTLLPQTWQPATADDLFHSVVDGTVRTAAVLKRQSPDALERIRASVREAMEAYAEGGVYRLPMPAVLVTATKPAEV